jgi:hypothetical protein
LHVLILAKTVLGYFLGEFFTNSFNHPALYDENELITLYNAGDDGNCKCSVYVRSASALLRVHKHRIKRVQVAVLPFFDDSQNLGMYVELPKCM